MKRILSILLVFLLLLSCSASAATYSNDPDAINESAQSVVLLAVYDVSNRLISTGSGFVAFSDEYVVTKYHVIEDADIIVGYTDTGDLRQISRVLCADSGRDLAVLVFDAPSGLKPLTLSEGSEPVRGEPAVTIGSPMGFRNSVSIGNISSAEEDEYTGYIQFTAPISSGSSGGTLLNDEGEVIGITTAVYSDREPTQNINFAVSSSYVIEMYNAHKEDVPVPLSELERIDIKTKVENPANKVDPNARDVTIQNVAGFSITEVYLYPDNAKNWGKARNVGGWLTNNGQIVITMTDEEVAQDTLWTLNFCFLYQKRNYYIDYSGLDLKEMLGRTLVIRMEDNMISVEIE